MHGQREILIDRYDFFKRVGKVIMSFSEKRRLRSSIKTGIIRDRVLSIDVGKSYFVNYS
jgi:hypothetical protein